MGHFLTALGGFAIWLGLSLALSAVYLLVYMWITPQHELKLIREGNISAAVCLSGTLLGYALPLASAMVHGANLYDFVSWAVVAMLVQLAVYLLLRLGYRDLTHDIVEDRVSVAVMVAGLTVTTGILNAAALST
ncbi:MAG: DUF350 domain-containing protein [Nevskia sp.]|nr:DUF350 domain-containing protein [Nevskia sp.]